MTTVVGPFSLERVVNAVEKVRWRLLKAAAALEASGVPYAIVGGNAVALWVSRVDETAVRNTQGVEVLIRREDLNLARTALESSGFAYRHIDGMDVFLDTPAAKPRDAVHIVFANERVRLHEPVANPDVGESENAGLFRVIALEALVRIKLTAFRDKDRTHLRDPIDVGLVDAGWLAKLHPVLAERLRQLLDAPLG
jgi:hypothetical protein